MEVLHLKVHNIDSTPFDWFASAKIILKQVC